MNYQKKRLFLKIIKQQQIISLLGTEQRPQFTNKKPLILSKIIEQCWLQNPQKRPTFKQIYEKFADRTITFLDSDIESIKQMALTISQKQFSNSGLNKSKIDSMTEKLKNLNQFD